MSIYANEQNVRKTVINIIEEFGVEGLVEAILCLKEDVADLKDRIYDLEDRLDRKPEPKKRGRPPKVVNG